MTHPYTSLELAQAAADHLYVPTYYPDKVVPVSQAFALASIALSLAKIAEQFTQEKEND